MDYRSLRKFLIKLQWLRYYRSRRKTAIPFLIRLSSYRKTLQRKVKEEWQASYVLLENGDYFYVPEKLDLHGSRLLLKPFSYNAVIDKFCKPGTAVIDIGSNIGEWALPMAKAVGDDGTLLSFEPIPFMCDAVSKTFKANGIFHAHCFPVAISNKTGSAKFFVNYRRDQVVDSGSSSLEYAPSEDAKLIEVQTTTLDEFLSRREFKRISFIKIDVEGHEYAVIEGAMQTLSDHRPVLIIETGKENEEKRKFISEVLKRLNYELIGIVTDNSIVPTDYKQFICFDNPFSSGSGRVVNVLFIPISK